MKLIAGAESVIGQVFTDKHVRLHACAKDGTRILVMRFYPRGVKKGHVDDWMRDLAPSPGLLSWCWDHEGELDPDIYANTWKRRYREEMEQRDDLIEGLRTRLRNGETLTLLCACHNPAKCHRTVLAEIICGIDGRA